VDEPGGNSTTVVQNLTRGSGVAPTTKAVDVLRAVDDIEVVLPAHNEGESIAAVLTEFYRVAHGEHGLPVRFLVCEDGSTDNTCDVVNEVARTLPVRLLSFGDRKGYSKAVVDGLRQTTGTLVAFVDSDGQCDPADLAGLISRLDGNDLVVGYRAPRQDSLSRKAMSGAFKLVYERMFPVRLIDPSCPYIVARRSALEPILAGTPGILRQGFWWEFNARARAAGLKVTEVPIAHRPRLAGKTQVYRLNKIPGIASEHLRGLRTLRKELAGQVPPTG
jgi:glycosyltransferase involved in cell wall biosynthesis